MKDSLCPPDLGFPPSPPGGRVTWVVTWVRSVTVTSRRVRESRSGRATWGGGGNARDFRKQGAMVRMGWTV